MAKALYGHMFAWIIMRINQMIAPKALPDVRPNQKSPIREIGNCSLKYGTTCDLICKYRNSGYFWV